MTYLVVPLGKTKHITRTGDHARTLCGIHGHHLYEPMPESAERTYPTCGRCIRAARNAGLIF